MRKALLSCFLFLFVLSAGFSQTGQVGALQGRVVDENGAPLPGVTVTISSPSLVTPEMFRVTNVNGVFRFPSLPPGEYEVVFELQGFKTVVRRGIIVSSATTTSLDITMAMATIEEQIVVEGVSPTIDTVKTTKTVKIDENFIVSIPAVRTLGNYFNMTPGVTGNTAHGGSVRDNVYSVDGVNTADPVVGTEALFFSVDTVEEISVQTGGLPAEYGQVQGAIVNVVSKSGGNEFHGSGTFYYRGEKFQSDNTVGTPLEGEKSGFKYELEPGINVGGPIIRDKIWFFLNASYWKQASLVSGYPYDQPEEEPVDQLRPYPYFKLTYQPNQDNKFVASYRYSDIRRNHRGASRFNTVDTTWKQKTATHVINLHYTRFFGANFFMNVKAFAYISQFDLLAKNDQPVFVEYTTSRRSGSYGYDDLNPRDRYSIAVDATLFVENALGSHEIKSGVEYLQGVGGRTLNFRDHPQNPYSADGYYLYYIMNYLGEPFYGVWYAPYQVKEHSQNIGLFVQDAWTITRRLTANIGLRFDRMQGIYPPQMQDEGTRTLPVYDIEYNRSVTKRTTAYTWNTLSPRAGLVFDVTGDGKTTLKASFARYYIANLTQWVTRGNPNGFVSFYGALNPDYSLAALWDFGVAGPEYVPKYGYGNFKFKTPYTDEYIIGIERELFRDTAFGVRYIRRMSRNNIEDADATYLNLDKLLTTGEYEWYYYEPVTVTDPYDDAEQTFYNRTALLVSDWYMINPPDANRDYDGVEVTLTKRYSHGWQLQASYVWQKSRGLVGTDFSDSWSGTGYYDNPNAHINAIGRFPLERTHQFKLQGTVLLPMGFNLGGYLRYLSGGRYTRQIRYKDITGTELNQGNVTIYAEPRGSRRLPDLMILDLRLEKRFKIYRTTFSVFVDMFNVFNCNLATSVNAISSHPTIPFNQMLSIHDPRIFRLGARFEF